ncbi:hypothetical protein E2C01_056544 [Portunus trituberculatus]|uniref:Uncharacterized protein n=1 Tax=Portunus trituberculatus TaxID=210409 RepID=A0A5B7GXY9_PORTR|nr:hypothetical protein [Portunus trituberculatus]
MVPRAPASLCDHPGTRRKASRGRYLKRENVTGVNEGNGGRRGSFRRDTLRRSGAYWESLWTPRIGLLCCHFMLPCVVVLWGDLSLASPLRQVMEEGQRQAGHPCRCVGRCLKVRN